jgi:hypothetical protein
MLTNTFKTQGGLKSPQNVSCMVPAELLLHSLCVSKKVYAVHYVEA